jgi:membrane fusion protein (multidrug efflux system)
MVVGADNKVVARPVKTGNASGNSWIITDGLKEGDQVVVEGLQKVQPGATVKPVPWQKAAPQTAPVAGAPGDAAAPAQPASTAPAAKSADQPKSK